MWQEGVIQGEGTFIWPNGNKYTGEWKQNQMHGEGMMWISDGTVQSGKFENGNFVGNPGV